MHGGRCDRVLQIDGDTTKPSDSLHSTYHYHRLLLKFVYAIELFFFPTGVRTEYIKVFIFLHFYRFFFFVCFYHSPFNDIYYHINTIYMILVRFNQYRTNKLVLITILNYQLKIHHNSIIRTSLPDLNHYHDYTRWLPQ